MKPEVAVNEKLRRYVRKLKKFDSLGSLISHLNASGEAYIFGGAPRDVSFVSPRVVSDLDIVFSGQLDMDDLRVYGSGISRTKLGGYRFRCGNYDVDLWELSRSAAFEHSESPNISLPRLLETVVFSTDGICVSLKNGKTFTSRAFKRTFETRRLYFVREPSVMEPKWAVRIGRLALSLNLDLSPAVASYFIQVLEEFGAQKLIDAESSWDGRRLLNEFSLQEIRRNVMASVDDAMDDNRT